MHFRKTKNYTNNSNEEQLLVSSYKKKLLHQINKVVEFLENINVTEKKTVECVEFRNSRNHVKASEDESSTTGSFVTKSFR